MDNCVYRFGLHHATHSRGFFRPITSYDVTTYSEASFACSQRRNIERDLRTLIDACRRQLVYSSELLHPSAPLPAYLHMTASLDRMIIHWDRIGAFYRRHYFDPQLDFFDCHSLREDRRWKDFIDTHCTEPFTSRPEWTRSLLEGADIIPKIPQSTSIPIEELFEAILAYLEGNDHELEHLF